MQMQQIIQGKKYNTETARFIAAYEPADTAGTFRHYEEGLYLKRNGEFFLAGRGGPSSRYAEKVGQNEWGGGRRIVPVSIETARAWCERVLSVEEYEDLFGEVAE